MALADIINRIDGDADSEGAKIVLLAEESAADVRAHAQARADQLAAARITRAERESDSEAQTLRAGARLAARDGALSAKRELLDEALETTVEALVALPDDAYAHFLGERLGREARGGETVQIAAADKARLASALPAAIRTAAPGLELTYSDEPAPGIEHGALLVADRSREDFSIATIVAERREELSMLLSRILFGSEGEA